MGYGLKRNVVASLGLVLKQPFSVHVLSTPRPNPARLQPRQPVRQLPARSQLPASHRSATVWSQISRDANAPRLRPADCVSRLPLVTAMLGLPRIQTCGRHLQHSWRPAFAGLSDVSKLTLYETKWAFGSKLPKTSRTHRSQPPIISRCFTFGQSISFQSR
jgi:hypothetical protein